MASSLDWEFTMNKRIRVAVAAAAVFGSLTIAQANPASAAHCVENGSTPGFSYFGQEGRTEAGNVGNPGATECAKSPTLPSPSTRAPGQNK